MCPRYVPNDVQVKRSQLEWKAEADLESGTAAFIIVRDSTFIARVTEKARGERRPNFLGNSYQDTPIAPLALPILPDSSAEPAKRYQYDVIAVNGA